MKKGFRILKFKKDKPIFEVKDISKSFDGRPILKKLSLKVFPGECVGVLGPNGCGKTTLFSMCIGEQAPDFKVAIAENKNLTLSELKGKYVLLYFYPKDNEIETAWRQAHRRLEKNNH